MDHRPVEERPHLSRRSAKVVPRRAATTIPLPRSRSSTPSASSRLQALETVIGLTPSAAATLRTLGTRSPGMSRPPDTSASTCSTSWR